MPEPRFSEKQIQSIVKGLRQDRAAHDARLKVRRLLIEMAVDATVPGNGTGTNVPVPFNKSSLIIQTLIGDVVRGVQQFTAMVAANQPQVSVPPVAIDRPDVTKTVDRKAADQERLLATLWDAADGRKKQWQVTWSAMWGRVGWYFTLPRDRAWGMPARTYYGDMSDDELQALKDSGRATPEPIQGPDGEYAYAESGSAYMERRKGEARRRAVSARSLFTLDAYGPDVVYPRYDSDGVKYAAAILEVPSSDFGPGSDYARSHHRMTGSTEDVNKYGMYRDKDGRILGGITTGGERDVHDARSWTYTIFGTREEVYCLVSSSPDAVGTLVWYAEHDEGDCPFVPAAAIHTDSARPGGEYSSPMEAVFSKAPIINQLETLLSNAAAYNAIPRWVIEDADGNLLRDAKTGDPVTIGTDSTVGLDPKDAQILGGKARQLTIDAEMLFKLLEFYAARLQEDMPSAAAVGQEGASGSTAWGLRQMIEQALSNLRQPVDNHAAAVKAVMQRWMHCMRVAAERGELETIYAFALPGKRSDARSVRGLIEFDPADLIDSIEVRQSADTAQARIVKMQAGIENLNAGVITMRQYLEDYAEEEDPRQAEIALVAYDLQRYVFYGDAQKIMPGSMLADFAEALRGRISQKLLQMSPAFAIATAEQMAMDAQAQFQQSMQPPQQMLPAPQGGNPASATGIVQPGIGMGLQQPGIPGGGQVPGIAPTPVGAA